MSWISRALPRRHAGICRLYHYLPSHVQKFVMRVAITMHNTFGKQDSVHRDAICSRILFGYAPSSQNTVPVGSKRVAMCFR
jgi:hypothetical protein